MQTLLTNENQSYKRGHRARSNITNLRIMKRKIISFVGLLLFVGVVAFNMQMVNSNNESNELVMENIEALAQISNMYCWKDANWTGDPYDNEMVWCSTCDPTVGYEPEGPQYKCTL